MMLPVEVLLFIVVLFCFALGLPVVMFFGWRKYFRMLKTISGEDQE